jgi:sulfotransferase
LIERERAFVKIHFIAGLPRSGSTLLSGILRQNPRFHASIQSPLAPIILGLIKNMSSTADSSRFISDDQRERVLRAAIEAFYEHIGAAKVVFDTSRWWPVLLGALVPIFREARVLCCLRNPVWIIDSIERQVQRNAANVSRLFDGDANANVYTRAEALLKNRILAPAMQNLRQAWFGEHADRLIAIPYDSLAQRPAQVIAQIYELLGEEPFEHDFDRVEYDEPEYDAFLGLPGFHRVEPKVEYKPRRTILPVDLFAQCDECFWQLPDNNPRGVPVLDDRYLGEFQKSGSVTASHS